MAALGLDYSFGDECMFLKQDNGIQRLHFNFVKFLFDDNIAAPLSTMATLGTEERGRCREVLNKSRKVDFLSAGTKASGR